MAGKGSTSIYERDVSKGFIPRNLGEAEQAKIQRVIDGLLQIESHVASMPKPVLDKVLEKELNYSDMFVQSLLKEQRKSNTLSLYPDGWFGAWSGSFEGKVQVDDQSELCCHRDLWMTLSIFQIESIPRLGFKAPSAYVVLMLSLYQADYTVLETLFDGSAPVDYVAMLDKLLTGSRLTDTSLALFEFLLYTVISLEVLQHPTIKSRLIETRGREIVSQVTFPAQVLERLGDNFYGKLWMRLRELGL